MQTTTIITPISWGDGENPASDDGCGFLIVKLAIVPALLLTLALAGGIWTGRDGPPYESDSADDNFGGW